MLAMTDAAAQAISALTEQQGEEAGGLRFAVQSEQEEGAQLSLAVAPSPEEGDQVLGTEEGARVFLEPQAADFLDDKVLDVQQDDEGQLNFAVMQQPEDGAPQAAAE
ncbi:iron-sulfur cluster biosynthesis protein [Amycolatopsis antarctica]|uniref:Iron-sulfur cluster biosynthesis protein n=1 Tax=Amycolatopsis antarctica TaxID=1854586 RepID=A0A263CVZ6_9PSEU|nr:iron-sulfur cluster biosynthesis family protein [Amycolatopsis antarctica]OZM70139.1 iron-sulfur cluster biosynthesis protein [Amycolatopsis antarctica]